MLIVMDSSSSISLSESAQRSVLLGTQAMCLRMCMCVRTTHCVTEM